MMIRMMKNNTARHMTRLLLTTLLVFSFHDIIHFVDAIRVVSTQPFVPSSRKPLRIKKNILLTSCNSVQELRGGSIDDAYDSDAQHYDDLSEEDESNDEEEVEDEYDEDDEKYDDEDDSTNAEKPLPSTPKEFDEPYFMSPSTQLFTTFGCIMFSKRINLFNPLVVRIIRFAFIAQILIQQLFIIYVRVMAKKRNDRTPVTTQNPLSGVLRSQLGNSEMGNGMMKSLASSFLSSQTTVMEYDMKEAKSMQGGVMFNMMFMYFLHFKMDQVQPLLIQVVTGMMQLIYSPLFQAYALGRNLERPFKKTLGSSQQAEGEEEVGKEEEQENDEDSLGEEEDDDDGDDEDDKVT